MPSSTEFCKFNYLESMHIIFSLCCHCTFNPTLFFILVENTTFCLSSSPLLCGGKPPHFQDSWIILTCFCWLWILIRAITDCFAYLHHSVFLQVQAEHQGNVKKSPWVMAERSQQRSLSALLSPHNPSVTFGWAV